MTYVSRTGATKFNNDGLCEYDNGFERHRCQNESLTAYFSPSVLGSREDGAELQVLGLRTRNDRPYGNMNVVIVIITYEP